MTIWIDGKGGSDSPAGANNIARLATLRAGPSAALKTLARLAAIANGAVGEGAVTPLQGETIVISGEIVGDTTTPGLSHALFNCTVVGSPAIFRPWVNTDGTPPAGAIYPNALRGDIMLAGFTFTYAGIVATMTIAGPAVVTVTAHGLLEGNQVSFTTTGALPTGVVAGTTYYVRAPTTNTFNISATPTGALITTTGTQSGVHTAGLYWQVTLPTSMTASNVRRCLIYNDVGSAYDGSPMAELDLVASLALVASTPNSYFIDGARLCSMNFTNNFGIVQNGTSGMRLDSDSSGAGAGVSIVVEAASDTTKGTAPNALLCLQRPVGTIVRGLNARGPARTSSGEYPISMETATNGVFEDCTVAIGGHHFIGHTGGGGGVGVGNVHRRIHGVRHVGPIGGAFACFSMLADTVTSCFIEDCVFESGAALNPQGLPSPLIAAQSATLGNIYANNVGGLVGPVFVNRCTFRPKGAPAPYINGGCTISNNPALTLGQEQTSAGYPVVFDQCSIGPCIASYFGGVGSNDYSSHAHRRGIMMLTGPADSAGSGGSFPAITFAFGAWGVGLPTPLPRNVLFENMLIVFRDGDRRPFFGTSLVVMQNGSSATACRFRNCVFLDLTRFSRGGTRIIFDYTSSAGNCAFDIQDSLLLCYPPREASTVRRLCGNDNGLTNAAARRIFLRNTYVGFTDYSADASIQSQANWKANVDPAGIFLPAMDLTGEDAMNAIISKLGTSWLNNQNLRVALRAVYAGGVPAANTIIGENAEIVT